MQVYDPRYIKKQNDNMIILIIILILKWQYVDKVYTNFRGLNVAEDDENLLQSFLLILFLFLKTNITCLDNFSQKIVEKQMIYYLGDNHFKTDED